MPVQKNNATIDFSEATDGGNENFYGKVVWTRSSFICYGSFRFYQEKSI